MAMRETTIDPVTFEIIKNRLGNALYEAGVTLVRTSGSEVTFGSKDYAQAYYTAEGDFLLCGPANLLHVYSVANIIKYLVQRYEKTIGINEGDQFVFSEPYLAGMHAPDVIIVAPIFWEGKRVGFCSSLSHQAEAGAIDPGGFCPRATESYQEGLRMVGLRLMSRGERCDDAFATIRNMVRTPETYELELLAKIASNNVLIKRYQEFIQKYGLDTMNAMAHRLINYSEHLARERLRKMADGKWTSVTYLDHDGTRDVIYTIRLTATKQGDDLILDWTGTDGQAPTFVNATIWAAMGCAFATLCGRLFWDIPWNEGLLRAVKVITPEDCIINARFPAPVAGGMPSGGGVNIFALMDVLDKMFLASGPEFEREASGVFGWSIHFAIGFGLNQHRQFATWLFMDCMSGGMGARTYKDGASTALSIQTARSTISNVEDYEARFPAILLFRRETMDSGGAGEFRGGAGGELAFVLRGAPTGYWDFVLGASGVEPTLAIGLAGGYPAMQGGHQQFDNTHCLELFQEGKLPVDLRELKGQERPLPIKGYTRLNEGDVLRIFWHGGGGFGDPLDRDPTLVRQDVIDGVVSMEAARNVYGVVMDPTTQQIDQETTEKRRQEIRRERLALGRV